MVSISRSKISQNPEDLIYELAGYEDSMREEGLSLEDSQVHSLSNKDSLGIIRRTLRRYNCTESKAFAIMSMMDTEELSRLKPCSSLDLGCYPLP